MLDKTHELLFVTQLVTGLLKSGSQLESLRLGDDGVDELIRTAAFSLTDVNGAEIILESLCELAALYERLFQASYQADKIMLVRTKSRFHKSQSSVPNGYRDLQLVAMILSTDAEGEAEKPMIVEIQLHLVNSCRNSPLNRSVLFFGMIFRFQYFKLNSETVTHKYTFTHSSVDEERLE